MFQKQKKQIVLSSVVILLPMLLGLVLWNRLPEELLLHWGADGTADGTGGKAVAVFGLPFLMLVFHLLCIGLPSFDKKNKEQSGKVLGVVLWIVPVLTLMLNSVIYAIAFGYTVEISGVVYVLLGLMLIGIGNYLPKCKQNHTIGIKVTWALRNEENWNKTHRFAGKVWVAVGVLCLVMLPLPRAKMMYLFLSVILLVGILPTLYSYLYYKKQLANGTATKEDGQMTSFEKKSTKASAAVIVFALVAVVFFLFSGKFSVKFLEESMEIEATYWEDTTVTYHTIDSVEYRETDDVGSRTMGYSSLHLLLGMFANKEFGNYTRYTYTSCDSCIVIRSGEKILVFNAKDEDGTLLLYETIKEKIK